MSHRTSNSIYYGHADGALTDQMYLRRGYVRDPYSRAEFFRILNLHLLLYDRLVIPDAFIFHNGYIRQALFDSRENPGPYSRFVRDGTIRVAFRDSVSKSFVNLDQQFREHGSYGHPGPEMIFSYAQYLDSLRWKNAIVYSEEQSRQAMASVVDRVLSDLTVLRSARMVTAAGDIRRGIGRGRGEPILIGASEQTVIGSRSWFYRLADQIESRDPARASRIRAFACAAFSVSIAHLLEVDPAYPLPAGSLVGPIERAYSQLSVRDHSPSEQFSDDIERSLLVGPGELATLTPDVIEDLRETRSFRRFGKAFVQAKTDADADRARVQIGRALTEYLGSIEDVLGLEISGLRQEHDRMKRTSKWLTATSTIGGVALGGVGLIIPTPGLPDLALSATGIAWGIVGAASPAIFDRRARALQSEARARLLRGPSYVPDIVQLSGTRR